MGNEDVDVYKLLSVQRRDIFTQKPTIHFPEVTPRDYTIGFKERYFLKSTNDKLAPIIEVTEIEFSFFKQNPFYKGVKLNWKVSGSIETIENGGIVEEIGVAEHNNKQVKFAEMTITGINEKLSDLYQFYKAD
jgi:ABC-type transporter Mla MlaB component